MPLLLPNLDDRNWAELVDEARALIPVYGPEWTDHNASDPGITLIELLAFIAEMEIYGLNQVSDRQRLKFLKLVGVVPRPPQPAEAVLRITLSDKVLALPAGVEFVGSDTSSTRFRTRRSVTLSAGTQEALQVRDAAGFRDLTPPWRRGTVITPFGVAPAPGVEFYLGLSAALPVDTSVQFFFTFATGHSSHAERHRILRESQARQNDCRSSDNPCSKKKPTGPSGERNSGHESDGVSDITVPLQHYGVRTGWEFLTGPEGNPQWTRLDPAKGEVQDNTRSFTLDGSVVFHLPKQMVSKKVGAVASSLYYLRCRFEAGSYDAAPVLRDVAFNGIEVQQAVPSGMPFMIDPGATITYGPGGAPKPGDVTHLEMELDSRSRIVELKFGAEDKDPAFLIYDYRAPSGGASGLLALEAVFLGFGTGFPNQQFLLPDPPVKQSSFRLYTLENKKWRPWELRPDFDASTRRDFHAVLDPTSGKVTFGTGEKGRVPPGTTSNGGTSPAQCLVFAAYENTLAEAGNVLPGTISKLADSPHNQAILDASFDRNLIQSIANPIAAHGGTAAESVTHALGRADLLVESSDRAVTLADYERLAMQTPGTQIARVSAIANQHPSFPCFKAPGMITVIVLPFLPQGRPMPSPGLLRTVRAYLSRRRIVGTRVEVVAPVYLDASVQAEVRALPRTNKADLQKAVIAALNKFLDPLIGGPDGSGWPLGRDIYRSEIMRVIDEVPGIDYVATLALIGEDGQPQCGNICLSPTWLVAPGTHQITIV